MIAPRAAAAGSDVAAPARPVDDLAAIRALVGRNLTTALRRPNALMSTAIQPVVFLLLLVAVYGQGLDLPDGLRFIDLVGTAMPLQAAVFVGMSAGGSLALDLESGMMDRWRAMPIPRSAVLVSRVVDAGLRMVLAVLLVTGVAVALGLRFQAGGLRAAGFVAVAVAFGTAWSWWPMWMALRTRSLQIVGVSQFGSFFPLFFLSGALVPVDELTGWVQPLARINPFTPVTQLLRNLAVGGDLGGATAASLGWIAALVVVFGGLALRDHARIGR